MVLCSSRLQKTLNQIIELIHLGLLQSTEAYRLLRGELALPTFGLLSVYFRNTKNQFQSKQIYVSPHRYQACSDFEGYLLHVTVWESLTEATVRPPHGCQLPPSFLLYPGPHHCTFCYPHPMDPSCSNSQINPKIRKIASGQPHPQQLGLAPITLLNQDPGAQHWPLPLLLPESGYSILGIVTRK